MKVKDRDVDQNTGLKSRQIKQVTMKNIFKKERREEKWKNSKKQIEGGKDGQLSGLESDENIGASQTR